MPRAQALSAPLHTLTLLALFVWYGAVYLVLRGVMRGAQGIAHLYWRLRHIP